MSEVQSVLIPYSFSEKEAKKWLRDNGFVFKKIDKTKHYMRFRQTEPDYDGYFTKEIKDGIKLIIGFKH